MERFQRHSVLPRTKMPMAGMAMKKLLLAGAALIAVSASTAAKAAVELPGAMLGAWCGHWAWQFPDDGAVARIRPGRPAPGSSATKR
jgi:hypothetical protein